MPIVRLKLVVQDNTERLGKNTLQTLADELGVYFDSKPSGTWVEVEYLPVEQYVENQCELPADMRTTLVYVLKHDLPAEEEVAREAMDLARLVSKRLQRPRRNTHVFYAELHCPSSHSSIDQIVAVESFTASQGEFPSGYVFPCMRRVI